MSRAIIGGTSNTQNNDRNGALYMEEPLPACSVQCALIGRLPLSRDLYKPLSRDLYKPCDLSRGVVLSTIVKSRMFQNTLRNHKMVRCVKILAISFTTEVGGETCHHLDTSH